MTCALFGKRLLSLMEAVTYFPIEAAVAFIRVRAIMSSSILNAISQSMAEGEQHEQRPGRSDNAVVLRKRKGDRQIILD